jgi:tRNA A37 N6-isopentenylltransferase MiaA
MNITLSANEELIKKARQYAKRHNTSLNNLIRVHLEHITNQMDTEAAAREFENLCIEHSGESPAGYRFDRTEVYNRK